MGATTATTVLVPRSVGARQGATSHATEVSIDRMVTVIVPLWVLAIAANLASHGTGANIGLVPGCALAVLVAYVAFLTSRTAVLLCSVLAVTAMLVGFAGPTISSLSVFPLIVVWLNMATTVTGALVPGRVGIAAIVAVSAAGGIAADGGNHLDLLVLSGIVTQGLVGGLCMWAGIATLRQSAAGRDQAAAELLAAQTLAVAETARIQESRRVARTLHDTVINTLGAIRALPISDLAALRSRCRTDLDDLAATGQETRTVNEILAHLANRARVLDLRLQIRASGVDQLPGTLGAALVGAIGEALLNAAKHSGSKDVQLLWAWDGRTGWAEVADSGIGLRGHTPTGGAADSIVRRCAEAGIAVRTFDRDGAVIRFDWSRVTSDADPGPAGGPQAPAGGPMMGLAAARVGLVMALFGVYSTIVTPAGSGRVGSGLSLLLILVVVAWSVLNQQHAVPSLLPVWLYVLAVSCATILPGMGMQGCTRIAWYWWGPLAGLVVLIAIALVDGRPWAVGVSAAGYVAAFWVIYASTSDLTRECSSETVSIVILDLGILLAILVLRRALVAQSAAAEESRRQTSRVSVQMAGSAAGDEVRTKDLDRAMSLCRTMLEGIAQGAVDPRDPRIRARAGRAESTLRAVNSLPPELGDFSSSIADRVFAAAGRGVELGVSFQGGTRPTPAQGDEATAVIDQWLDVLERGAQGRITMLGLHDATAVMLTGPACRQFPLPVSWARSDDDGSTLLETTWSGGGAEPDVIPVTPR